MTPLLPRERLGRDYLEGHDVVLFVNVEAK